MPSPPTAPAYWRLVSVLFSSLPLTEPLAMRLYHAACELYSHDESVTSLHGDLAQGEVRNLKRVVPFGALSGPGFEAHLETERGAATIRFLLTRQGLELLDETRDPSSLN